MDGIRIEAEGARRYVLGNTYPLKDALRRVGAHWDGERKAWWIGARKVGEIKALLQQAPAPQASERAAPGLDATVAGRATYKGRTYYLAGRVDRGRTHWDDGVQAVTTRDGAKVMLYFRDGSKSFWAPRDAVSVLKQYRRPTTIQSLRDYSERAKTHGTDDCSCRCHDEPNAGAPGSTLYDGCDRCGCEAC